jgi:squalene synthase HpnC
VVANASGENFPVALRVLPSAHRRHLINLYCFARLTDDLGDEAAETGKGTDTDLRLKLLDELTADVERIYEGGRPASPVMCAMAETVRECKVPAKPLLDLIQANRQDQQVTRYQTFAGLCQYCELSANPVGQLVLHVFESATADRIALSDKVCTALQILEHCQDVAEDFDNGRVYLPAEDLDRFGVTDADLKATSANAAVRAVVAFETQRARRLLEEGTPLVGRLRGWARLAVSGYLAGGFATAKAIADADYDVLAGPPKPGKVDTLRYWTRLLSGGTA